MKKFGTILVSRPAGKEAYLAYQPVLRNVTRNETIDVDFEGVLVLAPSWADEFLIPLRKQYGVQIELTNTHNPTVTETLKTIHWYGDQE